ncbi:unnamed protein product [Gongylonema pulchrum]|uniref:DEDD_Tnp_IS110 domain-containing protein n=1 Tax=Gongylonema pulchrum TaxID=637853 RepID=A0A183DJL5_9BILA|nr:unnamed protein product [Gongylonema pulchrum]
MIVSLRSLTNRVETVVVGIDADSRFWTINEKYKGRVFKLLLMHSVTFLQAVTRLGRA